MSENSPVFVRGYSRSGGTLMVTILDAHPQIAMSYELYPNLLEPEDVSHVDIVNLINILNKTRDQKAAAKKINDSQLHTFILRTVRGSLDNQDLVKLLKKHLDEGMDFSDAAGRLRFIERCCLAKMRSEGKTRWGLKCTNKYDDYLSLWPDAYFINIIRDGRDVLASQLNTGSFNKTPADVAKGWVNTHTQFRSLIARPEVNAFEVYYEKLVSNPEEEMGKICDFLGLPFAQEMLNFYRKDLTIYARKTGHLSAKRISGPIDSSKVGRWKRDVSKRQLEEFNEIAADAMRMFGYY